MGLFDDIETNVEDIQVDGKLPDDTYDFQITDVTVKEFADDHKTMGGQTAIFVELTVVGDSENGADSKYVGETYTQFLRKPNQALQGDGKTGWRMYAQILKQNLLSFGVPESMLGTWDPEADSADIIGLEGRGTLKTSKKNSDYQNLFNFTLTETSGVSTISAEPKAVSQEIDLDNWASVD